MHACNSHPVLFFCLQHFNSKENAMGQFETLFADKTGNRWGTKKFEKCPGKFYPLEIDYGGDEDTNALAEAGANSKLTPEIQQLVKMIFNVETMKKALLEFEVKKYNIIYTKRRE